jgi:hypothetical protein
MAIRRQLLVAVLAAVLVLATVLAVRAGRAGTAEPAGQGASPAATADATPATDPNGKPQHRRRSPAPAEATGGPSSAPDPEATQSGSSEESDEPVLEVPATPSPTPAGLPGLGRDERRRSAAAAELRQDYPDLQVRDAALVPRHPRRNVPVPSGADVDSSSIATADGVTHVGLVLRWPGSVDRVLRFYRLRLGRIGFTEQAPPSVPAGSAASFRRSANGVVVVAQPEGDDVVVSLHATLRTGD